MRKNKDQIKLAQYLQKAFDISWEEYMQRFESTKPLEFFRTTYVSVGFYVKAIQASFEPHASLSCRHILKPLGPDVKIIGGLKRKLTKEQFEKFNYFKTSGSGWSTLFHRRVVEQLLNICPDDFEPVPVTVVSQHEDRETYESKEFFMLNFLKCIDAIDQTRSVIIPAVCPDEGKVYHCRIGKFYYKDDPWSDGCDLITRSNDKRYDYYERQIFYKMDKPCKLAIDQLSGALLWHPSVAKQMPISSTYFFTTDEEQRRGRYYLEQWQAYFPNG